MTLVLSHISILRVQCFCIAYISGEWLMSHWIMRYVVDGIEASCDANAVWCVNVMKIAGILLFKRLNWIARHFQKKQFSSILIRSSAVARYMEKTTTIESSGISDIIEMVKQLTEQADKKIKEATEKIKAAESAVSTASINTWLGDILSTCWRSFKWNSCKPVIAQCQ